MDESEANRSESSNRITRDDDGTTRDYFCSGYSIIAATGARLSFFPLSGGAIPAAASASPCSCGFGPFKTRFLSRLYCFVF
eukprot:20203-Pelagococcus_subviridis.AAC.1